MGERSRAGGEAERKAEVVAREVKPASSRLADYKRRQGFSVVEQKLPKTTPLMHKRSEVTRLLQEKDLW